MSKVLKTLLFITFFIWSFHRVKCLISDRSTDLNHGFLNHDSVKWWLAKPFENDSIAQTINLSRPKRAPNRSQKKRNSKPLPSESDKKFVLNTTFNSKFLDQTDETITDRTIKKLKAIDVQQIINDATEKVRKRFEVVEPNIYKNNVMQKPGSIGWFVGASLKTSAMAKNLSRSALIAEEASKNIVKKYKLNLDQIVFGLTKLDIEKTSLGQQCPKPINALSCYPGRYRSYSGHCNNVNNPDYGCAMNPYKRALAPRYADGVSKARRSITGTELPSAREVSLAIHQGHESPFSHMTTLASFFGQFVFHDLSHVAQTSGYKGQRIKCCGLQKADLVHPECFPIKVSLQDPFMSQLNQDCLEYVRSSPAIRGHCELGPREQINQMSSFLDGSALYGYTKEKALSLRELKNGQLKAIKLNTKSKEFLPIKEENDLDCKGFQNKRCFKSGDERVNENLGLTIIHTLFMREHNRIARALSEMNPRWNDNEVFEETRKIVGAEIQHITYNEFLPYVLGEEMIDKYDIRLLGDGFYHKYDMNLNPTVENEIANAVFMFLFTMMPSTMERYSKDLNMIGFIKMTDSYFNPSEMFSNKLDQYVMGMISQNSKGPDSFVTTEMTNGLSDDAKEAVDFVALAIQRGRDHGLPGYTEYRRACQLEPQIDRFTDLANVFRSETLHKMFSLYKDVHDIDLFTGGLAEKPMKGAVVGPTFACLLGRQFNALRRGDRFWYENDMPPSSFDKIQLAEIRKTSLARILCDNGDDIDFVQPLSMISSDIYLNAFQYCQTEIIPRMDLTKWKANSRFFTNFLINDDLIRKEFSRAKREANEFFEYERTINFDGPLSKPLLKHYKTLRAKRQALAISNQSLVFERATQNILKKLRNGRDRETENDAINDIQNLVLALPSIELKEYLKNEALLKDQPLIENCEEHSLPCDHTSPFRTISGWCNNIRHPEYGKSLNLFNRFLPPVYEDGVSIPRQTSVTGKPLPSPRIISVTVHDDLHAPHVRYSLATMQWGQFLDHDITFTPVYLTSTGHLLDCRPCNSKQQVHPECNPIPIPKNDPFFPSKVNHKSQCLHFVRSVNAQKTLGPREQMNQLTSYVDASSIYGSDSCEAKKLRTFQQGKLNSTRHPLRYLKDLLPQTGGNIECMAPSRLCFAAGDNRASEQPSLACLHTIFLREHNRIAERLARINSHWEDEKIYQTTRKIIGALIQQITYREFLPRLLGKDYLDRFELSLLNNGYFENYDSECDGTIRNEISAAVLRLGHTLLRPAFPRLDSNFKPSKEPLMLRDAFFNSDMLFEPYAIDEILRGITTTSIQKFDHSITEEVTNHLFEEPSKPKSGMDLISLNLQRARDHGLPSYNHYREICNLTKAKIFEDLKEIPIEAIQRLKSVYDHVDDIDLFSGGVSETPLHGALVGPTFGCLLGMQFQSLRKCDRFWHENSDRFVRFTEDQLAEIRKVLLAKIICTNADDISFMQKQALDMPDQFLNPRISCSSLPEMNLNKWRDFDKSCMILSKVVQIGKHRRISPCMSCVCTIEGINCQSLRVDNCQNLLSEFSRNDIQTDQSCMVQCAYSIRNNQLQSSSVNMLRSMLSSEN